MSRRFDVVTGRKDRSGKTHWQNIGVAFENEKGTSIKLNALPLPNEEGEVWLKLFELRQREGGAPSGGGYNQKPLAEEDAIPFSMEWRA